MKKLLILFTTILFACALTISGFTSVFALTSVKTEIFAPQTYLEYARLQSPVDVDYDGEAFVIAESERILMYRDDAFTSFDLSGYSVSQIAFFDANYLLFLSTSELYTLSLETGEIKNVNVNVADSFAIFGDVLVTNPTNSLFYYEATLTESGVSYSETSKTTNLKHSASKLQLSSANEVYGVASTDQSLYRHAQGASTHVASCISTVRYSALYNGVYYYTSQAGVFAIDLSTQKVKTLATITGDPKTDFLSDPQGIKVFSNKLYIADASLNAVVEFDLITGLFSDFFISATLDSPGRISSRASDIQSANDVLYVLDGSMIKRFADGGTLPALPLAKFGECTDFAVTDATYRASPTDKALSTATYYLVTTGDQLYPLKQNANSTELTIPETKTDTSSYKNVTSITAHDGAFYFINNETISSQQYAVIYKLTPVVAEDEVFTIEKIGNVLGRGNDLTCDIFGNLYINVYNDLVYTVYTSPIRDFAAKSLYTTNEKILSFAVDFERNVYVLSEDDVITLCDINSNTETFEISKSVNLPAVKTAFDLCLMPTTDKMFALYDGFLLKLDPIDLKITSPEAIEIPVEMTCEFDSDLNKAVVSQGAKIFLIDLYKSLNDTFEYVGYEINYSDEEYAVLYTDDKYTVIVNADKSAIVRTGDLTLSPIQTAEKQGEYYLVTNAHLYNYPVVTDYFASETANRDDEVTLIATLDFNGAPYAIVKHGEFYGYIPETMLKTSVADKTEAQLIKTCTLGSRGATVYTDKELENSVGSLEKFEEVFVYEELENGVYKISYGDGYGYISKKAVVSRGHYVIRNLLLFMAILISLISSAIFVYRRYFVLKQKTE